MNNLRSKSWSPYAVGAGIGVLSWFAFATVDRGLGITTPFEHTAALIGAALAPSAQGANPYFDDHTPKIGWEWMLVVGVFLGSLLSSKLSGDRRHDVVPPMWRRRFGSSVPLRLGLAFAGGLVMMVGRAARPGLHERSRHHRRAPARGRELAVHRGRVHRRHRDGAAPVRAAPRRGR